MKQRKLGPSGLEVSAIGLGWARYPERLQQMVGR
jgi:aryl-alcohol dehydrogenase-like predicted oxidoreductase